MSASTSPTLSLDFARSDAFTSIADLRHLSVCSLLRRRQSPLTSSENIATSGMGSNPPRNCSCFFSSSSWKRGVTGSLIHILTFMPSCRFGTPTDRRWWYTTAWWKSSEPSVSRQSCTMPVHASRSFIAAWYGVFIALNDQAQLRASRVAGWPSNLDLLEPPRIMAAIARCGSNGGAWREARGGVKGAPLTSHVRYGAIGSGWGWIAGVVIASVRALVSLAPALRSAS